MQDCKLYHLDNLLVRTVCWKCTGCAMLKFVGVAGVGQAYRI